MERYYFAYGSNLNVPQMRRRCPGARPVGRCQLPNFQLEFRSVADVVPTPGAAVDGAIYTVTAADERALDRYEGYRSDAPLQGMYRKEFFLAKVRGKLVEVMYYVMNEGPIAEPTPHYFAVIAEGFRRWQLPMRSLLEARDRSRYGVRR